MFDISGAAPATKEGMTSLVLFKAWVTSLSCLFSEYLTVAYSDDVDLVVLGGEGLGSL